MESHLPVDLVIDILSRVSAKSIDRFRCVSKLWESILGHPHFKELFLTQSLARPRLLFTFKANEELFVFSSPQPQNPRENSTLVATPYKCFPKYFPTDRCTSHRRLVFLQRGKTGRVVFNPVTGESITLPKVKATGIKISYLGFDPISKQFKVLCMTRSRYGTPDTHRILTLMETGKGRHLWRTIQDSRNCYVFTASIVYPHKFVGMTGTGEIVFSPHTCCYPFYLFFYNIESSTATRIHFHGFEELKHHPTSVLTSLDFVEDVQAKWVQTSKSS
ncbi:putative F-box protein At1g53360 [Capsella rubella]|uniref:putative F-box protein At1g53360 n=1 Tax=Capsella rubella TaxID=81985 RepID=UPI000CD522EE|nr:putative F-box protein At1g53360 [Capsella rubella]